MTPVEKRYRFNPKLAFRNIGGQVIVVKPDENKILTLNETASFLWQALDDKEVAGEERLARLLEDAFEVSFSDALRDTRQFFESLLAKDLIQVDSEGERNG